LGERKELPARMAVLRRRFNSGTQTNHPTP
jgi:hypothetical protein